MLAILALIINAIAMAQIRLAGARVHIRKIIWYAFCRLVTSVVRRVIRPAVLYLSMLEKEKGLDVGVHGFFGGFWQSLWRLVLRIFLP